MQFLVAFALLHLPPISFFKNITMKNAFMSLVLLR